MHTSGEATAPAVLAQPPLCRNLYHDACGRMILA